MVIATLPVVLVTLSGWYDSRYQEMFIDQEVLERGIGPHRGRLDRWKYKSARVKRTRRNKRKSFFFPSWCWILFW